MKGDEMQNNNFKINFCISNQCFLCCPGCYNIFSQNADVPYKQLLTFVKYAKKQGLNKVTLSGGDPLAKKGIIKFLKKLIKMNLIINLDTVGTPFLTDCVTLNGRHQIKVKKIKNLKIFSKLNMIGIPLDASTNEISKHFRMGRENFVEEQLKIIKLLNDNGVNLCVNTVAHKQNLNDISNIENLLKNYKNIKKWQIFEFMPIGTLAKINSERYVLQEQDFDSLKSTLNSDLNINFKSNKERLNSYMLVNSSGRAYKVKEGGRVVNYGDVKDKSTWENIIDACKK